MKSTLHVAQTSLAILFFAVTSCLYAQAHKQPVEVGEKCDLRAFGEKDAVRFLAFDHDLRAAIEKQDAGKLALLVEFPLRVDEDNGAIFIHDARSLEGKFERVFTPAIQKAILATTRDEIWCNYSGISYGESKVWVNVTEKGFFVMTVNLPGTGKDSPRQVRTVDFACHTDRLRILIDSTKDGTPRYRSWSFARSLFDAPDLKIAKGEATSEGTGPCAHRLWKFQSGKAEIQIEEPGCYEVEPPANAQAELSVKADSEKQAKLAWCF